MSINLETICDIKQHRLKFKTHRSNCLAPQQNQLISQCNSIYSLTYEIYYQQTSDPNNTLTFWVGYNIFQISSIKNNRDHQNLLAFFPDKVDTTRILSPRVFIKHLFLQHSAIMLEGLIVEPRQSYNIWRHCHQNLMSEIESGIQDHDIKFSALWSFPWYRWFQKKLSMISSAGNSPALTDKILKM